MKRAMPSKCLRRLGWGVTLLLLSTLAGWAGDAATTVTESVPAPTSKGPNFSFEIEGEYSYVGDASTELRGRRSGDLNEQSGLFRAVMVPQWGDGPSFRLGVAAQRFSFGLPNRAPLPNTLESAAVVLGLDFQFGSSWLVRVEAEPGLYGDFHETDRGAFNVPFIIGGSYIVSADLQWVGGVSVDVNRQYPVIPAIGLRLHFADHLTLNFVLPAPRLEYEWSKSLTLYVGGNAKDGTYRVSDHFGDDHRMRSLNAAIVEYDEVRVGGGLSWKAVPGVTVEVEGGYLPYREFNFHRADESFKTESGAPYGQIGFSAKF